MAKLYFRYGVMGSAKTLNLLAVAHNYKRQGKLVLLLKPEIDIRFGPDIIGTRAGLQATADYVMPTDTSTCILRKKLYQCDKRISCILVDEAQFLAPSDIRKLHAIAHSPEFDTPVICYGLRTDFRGQLFPASSELMAIADTIEEIKTTCVDCNKKAIFNLKLSNGTPTREGPAVQLGFEETYVPTCPACYFRKHQIKEL
jgi:thymidine kinase